MPCCAVCSLSLSLRTCAQCPALQLDVPTREPFLAAARKQLLSEEGEWTHPPNPMPPFPDLEKDQDILRGGYVHSSPSRQRCT